MKNSHPITIFWFRRDLRLEDNAGLFHALKSGFPVKALFIFDTLILNKLEDKSDKRVQFIYETLEKLNFQLEKLGATLLVKYGNPELIWEQLCQDYEIKNVFCNNDYEPYAKVRDSKVAQFLKAQNIQFQSFKDQCIFEKDEILKDDGKPYTVFTPYSRKWKAKLNDFYIKSYPTENYFTNFLKSDKNQNISLAEMGFENPKASFPANNLDEEIIKKYSENRDFPGISGTSKLSVHLRFGTVSIRKLVQKARNLNETWLNELIWRDFYMMILSHFPHVVYKSFKPEYDKIEWRNNETEFKAWCEGKTGYPIVDAGMRELNETGFMHNRVRMVVASFLTKHLLINWQWGEAYFAKKLLDFDLSANNGGWQWAAGCGCDAAPYFRVFNPELQTQKFDAKYLYIKKWVPEYADPFNYPKPIVNHEMARQRVLEVYKIALTKV